MSESESVFLAIFKVGPLGCAQAKLEQSLLDDLHLSNLFSFFHLAS
jgi:hypothetical protein